MSFNYPQFLSSDVPVDLNPRGDTSFECTHPQSSLNDASNSGGNNTTPPDTVESNKSSPHSDTRVPINTQIDLNQQQHHAETEDPIRIQLPALMDDSMNGMFLEKISEDEPNVLGTSTFYKDSFNLPIELQGGIGTISSRRPSYAAESFTRSNFPPMQLNSTFNAQTAPFNPNNNLNSSPFFGKASSSRGSSVSGGNGPQANGNTPRPPSGNQSRSGSNASKTLSSFAVMNNFNKNINLDQLSDSFGNNLSLNSNFVDFQNRRPSQLADFQGPSSFSVFGPPPQSQFNLGPFQQSPQFQGQNPNYMIPGGFSINNPYLPSNSQQPPPPPPPPQGLQSQGPHQQQGFGFSDAAGSLGSQTNRKQSPPHSHSQMNKPVSGRQQPPQAQKPLSGSAGPHAKPSASNADSASVQAQANFAQAINLENGLVLKDQYIVASPELKELYSKTTRYFQNAEATEEILIKLNTLLQNPTTVKLINFIKNLNNLTFNHKILCLVINKNGKFDLLSYPNNSNICLQKDDLVVVDGDRGKDLVMIVEPLVNLNFAILFNFLKKLEHLKSLTIQDSNTHGNHNQKSNGTHPTSLNASAIINSQSNEDNEFIVTLPTKQVLRFATPKEIHKISGKFLEEKKAFITCYNKIKELNLEKNLTLINVEYQSDFKKLIFYYFANFKRIDFRGLIKELFKIYKTRIWLCAVLPHDKPEMYLNPSPEKQNKPSVNPAQIPNEYDLTNDQILSFSINEIEHFPEPNYFHQVNLLNLIDYLAIEVKGYFYGFNSTGIVGAQSAKNDGSTKNIENGSGSRTKVKAPRSTGNPSTNSANPAKSAGQNAQGERAKIAPSFNPFGDAI